MILIIMKVIIVEHNERTSVLMRTVKSVLERTPARLLDGIIVVDDFSDNFVDSDVSYFIINENNNNKTMEGLLTGDSFMFYLK